ncbi:MAG: RIP metalloprotease RseP [Betaproteobacteria bacterium]|nr:RIP metalloprotease RseP [Betaproteobacteria bacterium]
MIVLQKFLWFIVALGVLIVVHEYGHYLAARLCRVKVLRFSVGFGRPVFSRRLGPDGTEWAIAAVPLGGYVKMLDEREGPVEAAEVHRAFNRQNVWKRFFIVAAGPAFNFLFAVLAYSALFMHGLPEARPVLAEPSSGTAAQAAGLHGGELVRRIDGEAIATWSDVRWRIVQAAIERRSVELETSDDQERLSTHRLDLAALGEDADKDVVALAGLALQPPTFEPVIGDVLAQSAAERAGIKVGDRVLRVSGTPVPAWRDFVRLVQASPGKALAVTIERGELTLVLELTPDTVQQNGKTIGRAGVSPKGSGKYFADVSYGPLKSLAKGVSQTWELSAFTLRTLGKMAVGQVSWKHISGPITIADVAGQSALLGWIAFVQFLAVVSIGLGVLNLLPIPLLDGGHLMYYAIEVVKGRPVSERAMELGQRVGLALLLVMMAFAFYNDINRIISG